MALDAEVERKGLPDHIHRELRKGETIYHSMLPCHVSLKYPEGKWIAQVRRDNEREQGLTWECFLCGHYRGRELLWCDGKMDQIPHLHPRSRYFDETE